MDRSLKLKKKKKQHKELTQNCFLKKKQKPMKINEKINI